MNKIQKAKLYTKLQRKINGKFISDIPEYKGYHGIVTNLLNNNVYRFIRYDNTHYCYYILRKHDTGELVIHSEKTTKCSSLWDRVKLFGTIDNIKIFVSEN